MPQTLTVVEQACRETELPSCCREYARHTITLGWEERVKAHGRRKSDGGFEFGTSLPRGTMLREGDSFVFDDVHLVVVVVEQVETVFVVEPRNGPEWGLFAYHIGNRHMPLMITDSAIVCPEVSGMELLLQQHGIPYVRTTRSFLPVSGAAAHHH